MVCSNVKTSVKKKKKKREKRKPEENLKVTINYLDVLAFVPSVLFSSA